MTPRAPRKRAKQTRQRRNRIRRNARARVLRTSSCRLRALCTDEPHDLTPPRTRGECPTVRPCPWLGCRYHLWLDVMPNGSIKLNHPKTLPWQYTDSCALDAAELGGLTLEAVAMRLNISRERVRQIERDALAKINASLRRGELCH